ncbi:hypothetical protein AQUCO_07900001v1 [Aquilegia coerulea]|uniref:Cysteine-rich receptor-like protein kinase 2 n=1 Tax=Aquilegia coerulea TaxID=218851 RepID=A0A2G5C947_AQUCA|nr:hypothetical protein AQUCO_07900001v1 [Aquilegia coerulea]
MAYLWMIALSIVTTYTVAVISDPQLNVYQNACSKIQATNPVVFGANRNKTLSDLRLKLSSSDDDNHFATAQQTTQPDAVYAMVQCRNYLNSSDCLACFDAAEALLRSSCALDGGGRVFYDGCFLRYESIGFADQMLSNDNVRLCGDDVITQGATTFARTVDEILSDIVAATPKINGYFAASSRHGGGTIAYAVAQCPERISPTACSDCLIDSYKKINSCLPQSEGRASDHGCFLRYSNTTFFNGYKETDLSLFLKKGGSREAFIGAMVGGASFVLFVIMFTIWFQFLRKKPATEGDILVATELRGPINYNYKDLATATKYFNEQNKLGQGGFGDVYKGTLANGKVIAVKRLAIGQSIRAEAEFESEVKLISNVQHRNLSRLLGYCNKRQEQLLVYEYMANTSLDKFLFGNKSGTLNWKQRFDIIVGTSRGLAYLHEEFHIRIIHRDIKSSNILLDDHFLPRIADFGLARLLPEDQTHINTRFAGTLGYTAPEYAINGQLSSKVDTYSYGVVVLEIISGRRSNDCQLEPITEYLLELAWRLYEEDKLMDLVDGSLDENEYSTEEMKKVIGIALLCTQSSVARPSMSEVVSLLTSKGFNDYRPTRPAFIDANTRVPSDSSITPVSWTSNATIAITEATGR